MQPSCPYILGPGINFLSHVCDGLNSIRCKGQLEPLRLQQFSVLSDKRVLRFSKDEDKIIPCQRVEFDTYGESALQFRQKIRWFAPVKSSGGDEKNVVRFHHAVFGRNGRTLNYGKQISLHPFTGDVRPLGRVAPADLVHLIQKDDPVLFHSRNGLGGHIVHVDELGRLLLRQDVQSFWERYLTDLFSPWKQVPHHVFQVYVHPLGSWGVEDLYERCGPFLHLDLDLSLVQTSIVQHLAQFFPGLHAGCGLRNRLPNGLRLGRTDRAPRQEQIQYPLLCLQLGPLHNRHHLFFLQHLDRQFHKVTDNGFHITAHVSYLCEFGCLHLEEG